MVVASDSEEVLLTRGKSVVTRDEVELIVMEVVRKVTAQDRIESHEQFRILVHERVESAFRDRNILSSDQVNAIVVTTVHQTLTQLGVNLEHPLEMQRDLQYLHDWRIAAETLKRRSLVTISSVIVTAILGFIALGIKSWFDK